MNATQSTQGSSPAKTTETPPPSQVATKGHILDGRYRVVRHLGSGGIGVVYQVEHILSGKMMALKVLHNHLVRGRSAARETFQQEVRKLARLSHPHTIELFDCGILENALYIVMEYLPGLDLEKLLNTHVHIPWTLVLQIGEQACGALQHAHSLGFFHRNLKPANIILLHYQGEENFIKVLDFGLTTAIEAAQHQGEARQFFADAHYTAPEARAGGERPDAQSDLYSLAAILYEITIRRPYWKDQAEGRTFVMDGEDAVLLKPLLDALRTALDEDPTHRPVSAEEFLQKLLQVQEAILPGSTQHPHEEPRHKPFQMPEPAQESPSPKDVLSRQEWERVERAWRWRTRSRWIGLFAVFAALLGWFGYRSHQTKQQEAKEAILSQQVHHKEREPNDNALQATKIPLNKWVQGKLGTPDNNGQSDKDWYRFRLDQPEQFVSFRLVPPPLLDVEFGVYQLIKGQPGRLRTEVQHLEVLRSNNAQRGGEEAIPATRLAAGDYYLLVRELVITGEKPQPNIGPYKLIVEIKPPKPHQEREPNDTPATATPATLDKEHLGLHDNARDIDFFRIDLPSHAAAAKKWQDCKDCPQRPRRWSYYRTVFKDAPIYLLRFYTVPKVQAEVTVLNTKVQPLTVLDHQFQGLPKEYKPATPKKGQPSEPAYVQYLFTGEGTHYLRIETKDGYHYTHPYRWKIFEVPLR